MRYNHLSNLLANVKEKAVSKCLVITGHVDFLRYRGYGYAPGNYRVCRHSINKNTKSAKTQHKYKFIKKFKKWPLDHDLTVLPTEKAKIVGKF